MSSLVLVITSTFETAAMLAKASPRKPNVKREFKSSEEEILLVQCLLNALSTWSFSIPLPLSVIRIKLLPPFFISTVISSAPASIEFSTNSFTIDFGLSITSPAAILLMVSLSNKCIKAI